MTHNQGFLPKYDVWPFMVGPFFESGTIPLTLAPIWLLYGYLQPLVDEMTKDSDPAVAVAQRRAQVNAHKIWLTMQCMGINSSPQAKLFLIF